MLWKDVEPDIGVDDLSDLLYSMDCLSAIKILTNYYSGKKFYITNNCMTRVHKHVKSSSNEVGGLLLGKVFEYNNSMSQDYNAIVQISESIESENHNSTPVSLEMGTEIWNHLSSSIYSSLLVVGWYHSHPNLGAFFSYTDKTTQSSIFNHPYSIGWVIDPFRNEDKIYVGRDSIEYQKDLIVLNYR